MEPPGTNDPDANVSSTDRVCKTIIVSIDKISTAVRISTCGKIVGGRITGVKVMVIGVTVV
jgi:hypothetical protein